jgi:hypothetical protein
LRQLGLAMHQYHVSYDRFPVGSTSKTHNYGTIYYGLYSHHSRLLPYLEQSTLYASINFSVDTFPPEIPLASVRQSQLASDAINGTAFRTRVDVFLCPSDPSSIRGAGTNYRGNTGIGPYYRPDAEHPDSGNGVFPELTSTSLADVLDGSSHTCAYSERLIGSLNPGHPAAHRDSYSLASFVRTGDDLVQGCQIAALDPNRDAEAFVFTGHWWFWVGRDRTLYTHTQAPNGPTPDCEYGGHLLSPGMMTARSFHSGGVSVLMTDGSLRFTTSTVSTEVWRALGTRAGGELVD